MLLFKQKYICLFLLGFPLFGELPGISKDTMITNLETIKGIFQTQYAPIEWKETFGGWNLEEEIERAKEKVKNIPNITVKNYQRIVRNFCNSMKDFHVKTTFYSTEFADLPLLIKSAEGRYFVVALLHKIDPLGKIQVGDEIISFDGVPIQEAVNEFRNKEFNCRGSLSSQVFAELCFFKRIGSLGQLIPKGTVEIGIKHKESSKITYYTLEWNYRDEKIKNIELKPFLSQQKVFSSFSFFEPKKRSIKLANHEIFKKSMLCPYYEILSSVQAGESFGSKESFLPCLGEKLWSQHPDSDFHAYLFETPDHHRYGYIRIPNYSGTDYEFEQFKELILKMEQESEALIIDQMNNPGGSVFYMYALLSTLTDKPLLTPLHRITLTQKEISFGQSIMEELETLKFEEEAKELFGNSLDGFPIDLDAVERIKDYFLFIESQWNLGITFTPPFPLWGFYEILPNPDVCYTKPILVLINSMDFSCGDLFPCLLKDNHRATLLGSQTGGAGGFVLSVSYPNLFGIEEINYTGSMAYRIDESPIEDLGVQPDIEYRLTVEDLTQSYEPFKQKILESIKNLSQ